ncbi:hypothetical protein PISMIDRAFT_690367, partial [Pisolithus microcarpus 441]
SSIPRIVSKTTYSRALGVDTPFLCVVNEDPELCVMEIETSVPGLMSWCVVVFYSMVGSSTISAFSGERS